MIRFRYWLSIKLIDLAIGVLPDEASKLATRMGLTMGMEMLENAIEDSHPS